MKSLVPLRQLVLAVAAFAFFAWGTCAKADLVQNGEFLSTSLSSPGGYVCNTVGSTCTSTVTDWSADCSSQGICGNGNTPLSLLFAGSGGSAFNGGIGLNTAPADPPAGNYIADDGDGTYRASIYQLISGLTVGNSYVVTFYQAAAEQSGDNAATTEQWQVALGSSVQDSTLMNNPAGGFTAWNQQTMTFTATSTSEYLNFLAIGRPSGVPPVALLADVSLNPVPEPASVALFGAVAGFFVIGMRRRRRA
jgi:hypothetical protein